MQPNEQPTQHPIDYLDEIATVPKGARKGPSDKVFFGAIIVALLVALIIGAFAFMASGDNTTADLSTLSERLKNLQTVTEDSEKKIVSSSLRARNTSLSLVLTNANRDITEILTENGINSDKLDPKIVTQENIDELNETLEDARLNAIYDRVYAREMTYRLDTVLILLEQLESETNDESQKEFLSATYDSLQPLHESFAKFNASS